MFKSSIEKATICIGKIKQTKHCAGKCKIRQKKIFYICDESEFSHSILLWLFAFSSISDAFYFLSPSPSPPPLPILSIKCTHVFSCTTACSLPFTFSVDLHLYLFHFHLIFFMLFKFFFFFLCCGNMHFQNSHVKYGQKGKKHAIYMYGKRSNKKKFRIYSYFIEERKNIVKSIFYALKEVRRRNFRSISCIVRHIHTFIYECTMNKLCIYVCCLYFVYIVLRDNKLFKYFMTFARLQLL